MEPKEVRQSPVDESGIGTVAALDHVPGRAAGFGRQDDHTMTLRLHRHEIEKLHGDPACTMKRHDERAGLAGSSPAGTRKAPSRWLSSPKGRRPGMTVGGAAILLGR